MSSDRWTTPTGAGCHAWTLSRHYAVDGRVPSVTSTQLAGDSCSHQLHEAGPLLYAIEIRDFWVYLKKKVGRFRGEALTREVGGIRKLSMMCVKQIINEYKREGSCLNVLTKIEMSVKPEYADGNIDYKGS